MSASMSASIDTSIDTSIGSSTTASITEPGHVCHARGDRMPAPMRLPQ